MPTTSRAPTGLMQGLFPWTASGCAIANGHGKILGGGMVGTHAGDMIVEVAWLLTCM